MSEIGNPGKAWWPSPRSVTPEMEGPYPWSLLPCGCHLRQPDFEAVLCNEHLAELNGGVS